MIRNNFDVLFRVLSSNFPTGAKWLFVEGWAVPLFNLETSKQSLTKL